MTTRHEASDGSTIEPGDVVVLHVQGLEELIASLIDAGFDTRGPSVRNGAIVPGALHGVTDLPKGVHDVQAPGRYRLEHSDDGQLFGWAVGPGSWKAEFFPPSQELWRASPAGDSMVFTEPAPDQRRLAIIGARPCEVAALSVLDRVLANGEHRDPRYVERRDANFVVVVECGRPGATCFCSSMGTGPGIDAGFDVALTEVDDSDGHRFVARPGTQRGADFLSRVTHEESTDRDRGARVAVLERAGVQMGRRLDTEGLASLLARNVEHPHWDEVAERCLSCANCTLVCPTCFCSDVRDTTDLAGDFHRRRTWSSCFDLDHSYLHGGPVRASVSSRYRQWMTHKLSTWWDQFDTSGCVGCGRCVTWCPVGIDITEEVRAIATSDGASRRDVPSVKGAP